ncbi:hypothetical protein, partial [Erwinia rhapontici]|uniref:hypothetical protein n=1 Tax=Erwinia rhapontici TaxID=55212 RepID=UPI003B9F0711
YAFLLRSQLLFEKFFPAVQMLPEPPEPLAVSRCAVSVVAHYRDPNLLHKPFLDLSFWLLSFHSFR